MARPILIMPTIVMPVFFVVSFTGAFSALTRIEGYGTDNVYNWMAPYAALQGAVFAGVGGAASAADDLENGFFDRLLLTPGGRFPLLAGTIGYSGVRSLIPTTAVLVVSYFGGLALPGGPVGLVSLYVATVGMAVVFCLIGLAIVCGLGVWLGLHRTRIGKVTVAVINEPEVSAAMGVNIARIYLLAFGLGVFLAALGGAFTSPLISVQPGISVSVIVVSFAVVIIGGLGSIPGAAIGALIVGLARSFAVYEAPEAEIFIIYLVMVIVLIFRPEGLFTPVQARKI